MATEKHPLASRPSYDEAQLTAFLSALSPPVDLASLRSQIHKDPLSALYLLQQRTMAFNAWGNIALHYSKDRRLPLDPDSLFHKIVNRRLGGYCMENNGFFAVVLQSLGFELYVTGARISWPVSDGALKPPLGEEEKEARKDGFGGWSHEVLIVTVQAEKYMVDVGFGSQGPLTPIPIRHGATGHGVPGVTQRLQHRPIAAFTAPSQNKLWVLEFNTDPSTDDWMPGYCFSTQEWLPGDFENLNYRVSQDPMSWFTYRFVLTKPLLDESGEKCVGVLTVFGDEVTRRMGDGEKQVLKKCGNEGERVQALQEFFGITLTEEEIRGGEESRVALNRD